MQSVRQEGVGLRSGPCRGLRQAQPKPCEAGLGLWLPKRMLKGLDNVLGAQKEALKISE